ncbi:MAG: tyrosine--tRNA ligase [Candidatus Micrarchaeia archaeon]
MDIETKIKTIKSFAAEIVTEAELKTLFETNEHPIAYDGFEPSGLAAIHFGLLRTKNLRKMLSTGIKFKLYIADYFAMINNKFGGDLEKIKNAGRYFIEVWKAAGIDLSKVEVIWNSELMDDFSYWDRYIRIGRLFSVDRVKRAITIMGRKEGENISASQLFYPIMQATDIFQMDIDICQLGIDQRKASIIAREAAEKLNLKIPIIVSHPLLIGLKGMPQNLKSASEEELINYKMSKSDPKNAIFVHDSYAQIKEKINSAYCPEKIIDGNPVFEYLEKLIIEDKSSSITLSRPEKFGGAIEFEDYSKLVSMYKEGKVHPADVKNFVAEELEKQIKPIREHFEKNAEARKLYEEVKGYTITR